MKMSSIVLAFAITICAGVFSSCSDEPTPPSETNPANFVKKGEVRQGEIDINTLNSFTTGLNDAAYTLEEYALYQMDDYSNGLWEEQDLYDLIGWTLRMPSRIIIKDGQCWEPITKGSSATGPTLFSTALNLINRVYENNYSVYIKRAIAIDKENITITIGQAKYGILLADAKLLALSYECPYSGGRTHNGGLEMWIATYSLSETLDIEESAMNFDTTTAAYDWLIKLFRETFGDSVDCNKYYNGEIILDNPMLYLEDLIEERDRLFGR